MATNIEKFLLKYNIPFSISGKGIELTLKCPFHSDNNPSLNLNVEKKVFICWSCGEKGKFRKLALQLLKGRKISEESLAELSRPSKETKQSTNLDINMKIDWPKGYISLSEKYISNIGNKAKLYLNNRNITDSQIAYYKLGFTLEHPFAYRIIIPIFDLNNDLVSFVARSFVNATPKVLTPIALSGTSGVKDFVFNLNNACKTEHLLIGEGVFDAMSLGTRGVALLGKSATKRQLAQIVSVKPKRITICLDADAETEANILARQLLFHVDDVRIAKLPKDKDPNSVEPEILEKAIKEAYICQTLYNEFLNE